MIIKIENHGGAFDIAPRNGYSAHPATQVCTHINLLPFSKEAKFECSRANRAPATAGTLLNAAPRRGARVP